MDQRREPARRTFASRRGLEGEIVDSSDVGGMRDTSNMSSTGDDKMVQAPMSLLKRAVEALLVAPGREAITVCGELHEALLKSASTAKWVPNEQAWADGFEAGATWPQHTASGVPVDPPLNPYEPDEQRLRSVISTAPHQLDCSTQTHAGDCDCWKAHVL